MKRIVLFFSLSMLVSSFCISQESLSNLLSEDKAVLIEEIPTARDPEIESTEWAFSQFASFVQDKTMCDVGTALYEDSLRRLAMREHPEWPIWAVDLALDKARDSYLRTLLFSK